jgi:hypothetical protein
VKVVENRPNPRNSKMSLWLVEELLSLRRELLSLCKEPADFIVCVFSSCDSVWVERCSAIVQDRADELDRGSAG